MIFYGPKLEKSLVNALLVQHTKSAFVSETDWRPGITQLEQGLLRSLITLHFEKALPKIREHFQLPNLVLGEMIRFNSYNTGSSYKAHYDNRGLPNAKAEVSVIVGLNDDFEGGDLVFTNGPTFKIAPGEFVAFRGDIHHHGVTNVSRGVKRTLVSYYRY